MRTGEIRSKDMFPYHFIDLFVKRVLPVAALSYLISFFSVAFSDGGFFGLLDQFLGEGRAYFFAVMITGWVSLPSLIWMSLVGSREWEGYAKQSYWAAAGLMILFQLVFLLLFPEDYGRMRLITVVSLPLHLLIFLFLIWPFRPTTRLVLKACALVLFLFGLLV